MSQIIVLKTAAVLFEPVLLGEDISLRQLWELLTWKRPAEFPSNSCFPMNFFYLSSSSEWCITAGCAGIQRNGLFVFPRIFEQAGSPVRRCTNSVGGPSTSWLNDTAEVLFLLDFWTQVILQFFIRKLMAARLQDYCFFKPTAWLHPSAHGDPSTEKCLVTVSVTQAWSTALLFCCVQLCTASYSQLYPIPVFFSFFICNFVLSTFWCNKTNFLHVRLIKVSLSRTSVGVITQKK